MPGAKPRPVAGPSAAAKPTLQRSAPRPVAKPATPKGSAAKRSAAKRSPAKGTATPRVPLRQQIRANRAAMQARLTPEQRKANRRGVIIAQLTLVGFVIFVMLLFIADRGLL